MYAYTVKQLSDLAGVSRRTLHFYDRIGLLKPEAVQPNGYRIYGRAALLRLQQILFYKEMDFNLDEIGRILDEPGFDTVQALEAHRQALLMRKDRLDRLIHTVDHTILALQGETEMNGDTMFEGFTPEQEKHYEEEATRRWGDQVKRVSQKWNRYSAEQKKAIMAEAGANYQEIVAHMGEGPDSPAVQAAVEKWRQNMRYFYEPTIEIMRGLGSGYNHDPEFHATFVKFHPDLPAFLEQAITVYCDRLEGKGG